VTRRLALNHARAARADGQHESVDSDALAADGLEADDALWAAHRRDALDKALASLPMRERRALSLAYFDELTQEQVARALGIPLGTAKTRIRLGLKRLAPAVMALLGLLTLVLLLVLWRRDEQVAELNGDALRLATSSDVTPVRLVAVAPTPPEAHGNYRARAGDSTAVLTVSHLPPLSDGLSYTAWIRHGETWTSLGSLDLRSDGSALRVMRDRSVSVSPDELRVTREPRPTSVPRGDTVLAWPRQR
jgi:hypothetical protein